MHHVVSENRSRLHAAQCHSLNQPALAFPCQNSESPEEADSYVIRKHISSQVGCIHARGACINLMLKTAVPLGSGPCVAVMASITAGD